MLKTKPMETIIAFSLFIAASFSTEARAVNLVVNGGFETGDLSGWTTDGWATLSGNQYDGNFYAGTGSPEGVFAYTYLSQGVPTLQGQLYDISFAFIPGLGVDPNNGGSDSGAITSVSFGNTVLTDSLGIGPNKWTVYTFKNVSTDTFGGTELLFSAYQNYSENGIDDVSVTLASPVSAVPLPGALPLLGVSVAGLGAIRWRKARRGCARRSAV